VRGQVKTTYGRVVKCSKKVWRTSGGGTERSKQSQGRRRGRLKWWQGGLGIFVSSGQEKDSWKVRGQKGVTGGDEAGIGGEVKL